MPDLSSLARRGFARGEQGPAILGLPNDWPCCAANTRAMCCCAHLNAAGIDSIEQFTGDTQSWLLRARPLSKVGR